MQDNSDAGQVDVQFLLQGADHARTLQRIMVIKGLSCARRFELLRGSQEIFMLPHRKLTFTNADDGAECGTGYQDLAAIANASGLSFCTSYQCLNLWQSSLLAD